MTLYRSRIPDETIAAIPADAWHHLTAWVGTTDLDTVYVDGLPHPDGRLYTTADPRIARALEVLEADGWPALAELIGYPRQWSLTEAHTVLDAELEPITNTAPLEDYLEAIDHTIEELAHEADIPLELLTSGDTTPTRQTWATDVLPPDTPPLIDDIHRWAEAWHAATLALLELGGADEDAPTQRLGYHNGTLEHPTE